MTAQPSLNFDGVTYDPQQDSTRLGKQLEAVKRLMSDGHWRTLSEISLHVPGSEAGISARLRDCRKIGWTVERRRRTQGTFEYRVNL